MRATILSLATFVTILLCDGKAHGQLSDSCTIKPPISEPICKATLHHESLRISDKQIEETPEDDRSVSSTWLDTGRCVQEYCLFANLGFNKGRGISVISTLKNVETIKDITAKFHAPEINREPPFHVAAVPGKGLGLLASTSLVRGSPIMSMTPALVIHRTFLETLPPQDQQPLLDLAVSFLTPATRSLFLGQMGHFGGHKVTDILATNSFQTDVGGEDGHHYANYPVVSRYNHDCRPNVVFLIDEGLVHRTTVVRDIEQGEELTITYLDSFESWGKRQERATGAWGFGCTCQQCSLDEKEIGKSDRRLEEIGRLQMQLEDWRSDGVTREVIRRFVKLYRDERLHFAIAGAYTLAALNHNMLGDEKMAVKYAKLAVEAGNIEFGEASGDVKEMQGLLSNPMGHFSWRKRVAL